MKDSYLSVLTKSSPMKRKRHNLEQIIRNLRTT